MTCLDLNRLARLDPVQHAASHLANKFGSPPPSIRSWEGLRQSGIRYLAPATIEALAAQDARFTCFYSTDMLEHIPADAFARASTSTASSLGHDGLSIHAVDYSDHCARFVPALSRFNFLTTYSDQQWKRRNPRRHYVNRRRHSQLRRILGDCGFTVLSDSPKVCPAVDAIFGNLATQFKVFAESDLFTQRTWFVCRPKPRDEGDESATR